MFLDLPPLRRHRDFRFVFLGQWVSGLGSFLSYVALPVQIYDLTKSSWAAAWWGRLEQVT